MDIIEKKAISQNIVKVNFLGIRLGRINRIEIVDIILEIALAGKAKFITYLNAHCFNTACLDNDYQSILNSADLVYAGGQGLVWASKFLGIPLPERVNILDFFDILVKKLRNNKITIYLLGNERDTVKKTEEALKAKGLKIIGYRDGFFDKEEEKEIIQEINVLKPNILMIGMGVPKQEKWLYSHLQELDVNLCWAVGAAFDWLSGKRKRAPKWMRKFGLEWVHRLFQHPKKLWRRYLLGNLFFIYRVVKYKIYKIH